MKKVLKLSSLLAAVLLLTVLAGVQLLSAQATAEDISVNKAHVSNIVTGLMGGDDGTTAIQTNAVLVTVDADLSDQTTTTVTVTNKTTKESKLLTNVFDAADAAAGTTDAAALAGISDTVPAAGDDKYDIVVLIHKSTSTIAALEVPGDAPATAALRGRSIAASDGDVIEFRYQGRAVIHVAMVTVDAAGPKITGLSPSHNSRTNAGAIRFAATITDAGVGIGDAADDVDATFTVGGASVKPTATKPDGGSSSLARILAFGEGVYEWQVTAKDALGNTSMSEAVADDDETDEDESVGPNTVIIDITGPSLASATTGVELGTDDDDNPIADATGSRKAIAVTFLDGGADDVEVSAGAGLNGTTVDDGDFRVDVGNQSMDIADVTWEEKLPKMVFITLENELAGDDEPVVRLVGPVSDTAGNSTGTGEVDASDGIAPVLSVSVDASGGTVTVLVSTDEDSRNPRRSTGVTIRNVVLNEDDDTVQEGGDDTFGAASFRTVTSGEQWEWKFEFDDDEPGKYNVCAMVYDISGDTGNMGSAGTCGEGTALSEGDDGKSITFEVDTGVPAPTVEPEATDNTAAFIEIDFSAEASEYVGDSMGKISSITVMIDGEATETATLDSKVFSIAPPADGYAVGELELTVTATDESGNTATFKEIMVEITERDPFTVNLRPGYNLISLPGTPASTAINDVIGADHSINQVLTYSPFVEGGWLSAERGDDGAFAGTLTEIDGSTAYIVRTTSFDPLKVDIPRMTLGNVLPPQTNLGVGWNLVPVIDLSSDLASGGVIEDYFQGVGDAILTIDDSGRLQAIDTDDGVVGKGYWIYASRAAVLLPTRR